jgi:hypothetical protein
MLQSFSVRLPRRGLVCCKVCEGECFTSKPPASQDENQSPIRKTPGLILKHLFQFYHRDSRVDDEVVYTSMYVTQVQQDQPVHLVRCYFEPDVGSIVAELRAEEFNLRLRSV